MKHSKSSKAKQIYFHEKKLLLKFKFQFNSKNPSPQSSWHWQRSIWESHQTSQPPVTCLLLNITNDCAQKASHKCLNLHFTERKETSCQKPANHCQSVPNLACLAGLWHSPLALLVPVLGSQANTSSHLQSQNQWAAPWNVVCGELPLLGISPTQLSSPFV